MNIKRSKSTTHFYRWALATSLTLHGLLIAYFGDWNILAINTPQKKPELIQKVKLVQPQPKIQKEMPHSPSSAQKNGKLKKPGKHIRKKTQKPKKVIAPQHRIKAKQRNMVLSKLPPLPQPNTRSVIRKTKAHINPIPPKKIIIQKTFSQPNSHQPRMEERMRLAYQKPQALYQEHKHGIPAAPRKSLKIKKVVSKEPRPSTTVFEQTTFSEAEGQTVSSFSRNQIIPNKIVQLPPVHKANSNATLEMFPNTQTAALNISTNPKFIDSGEDSGVQENSSEVVSGEGFSGPNLLKLKSNYVGQIRDRVARFKYYPKRALRRELEGKPVLLFKLGKEGQILDLKLSKSSGSPLLDQAALDSVKKAAPYPALPMALKKDFMTIQLPVSYTLD